jgi:hypothetical protein
LKKEFLKTEVVVDKKGAKPKTAEEIAEEKAKKLEAKIVQIEEDFFKQVAVGEDIDAIKGRAELN